MDFVKKKKDAAEAQAITPMTSPSFMINRSSPLNLISVPDHLPNKMRSPTFTSGGLRLPLSSRVPEPTATISPSAGFFLGGVWNDNPALGFIFGLNTTHDDPVV